MFVRTNADSRPTGEGRGPRFRRIVALLVAALTLSVLVAACGGSDDDGSDSAASSENAASTSAVGSKIAELLEVPEGEDALQGEKIDVGAVFPLSGSGSFYGEVFSTGVDLAVKHIKEAGGPEFNVIYKDNKSGDPEAGTQVTRELGIDGVPLSVSSFSATLGSQLPGLEQYKIFTLDGGGGAPVGLQGKPYFYGTRAVLPTDMFNGILQYAEKQLPDAKSVSFVTWDTGPEQTDGYKRLFNEAADEFDLEPVGFETAAIGETDFSDVIAKLKQQDPDIVLLGVYGLDPANFMKQYQTSGLDSQIYGFEVTPEGVEAAGDAYKDIVIAGDSFIADKPDNQWAELYAKEYQKANKKPSDFFAANYYEDMFALWTLGQRVKASGGDIRNGEDYVKALESDPSFPSLYGGNGEATGTMEIDPETHTVSHRIMTVFEFPQGGKPTPVATFDIGGADYTELGD